MLKHPPCLVFIPLGEMGKPRQGLNWHQSPREQEGSMATKSLGLGFPGPWIPILALPLIGDAFTLPWAFVFSSVKWVTSRGTVKLNNTLKGSAHGGPMVDISRHH